MTRHKERIQQTTFEKIYPTHHLDCIKTKKLKTQQKEKKKVIMVTIKQQKYGKL